MTRWLPCAAALAALAFAPSAHARVYSISITGDDETTNGNCTLREAIQAAASDAPVDACPAGEASDTIELAAGSYTFTLGNEIVSGSGVELEIRGVTGSRDDVAIDLGFQNRFLQVKDGATVRIADLTIRFGDASASGGAIQSTAANLDLDAVRIASCSAVGAGGAVSFESDGPTPAVRLTIRDSSFESNDVAASASAATGGALRVRLQGASSASILGSDFLANALLGDAFEADGGGAFLRATGSSELLVAGNDFAGNRAESDTTPDRSNNGGGLAMLLEDQASATVGDNRFSANVLDSTNSEAPQLGSGLSVVLSDDASAVVDRSLVLGNDVEGDAALESAQVFLSNASTQALLFANALVAGGDSAGVFVVKSGAGGGLTVNHTTIADNAVYGLLVTSGADPAVLTQTILAGNPTPIVVLFGALTQDKNLIDDEPGFVDAVAGDYRLKESSDAVDGGSAALPGLRPFDAAHATRVVGDAPDIGAFEFGAIFSDGFESGDLSAWSSAS